MQHLILNEIPACYHDRVNQAARDCDFDYTEVFLRLDAGIDYLSLLYCARAFGDAAEDNNLEYMWRWLHYRNREAIGIYITRKATYHVYRDKSALIISNDHSTVYELASDLVDEVADGYGTGDCGLDKFIRYYRP